MAGPNLPSSFASAAAGQNSGRDRGSARGESRGSASGDWLRRDGRSNGTAILRRSSTTPFNNQTTTLPAIDNSLAAAVNDPPASIPSPFFAAPDAANSRYSKDDLLQLGKMADSRHIDINALMMAGFSPGGHVNGNASRGWGKPNDAHAHNDPTVCWDSNGDLGPLGHQEMSSEEKELYSSDVNSPLKQQQQNQQNKEGVQGGAPNGRKLSMSQNVASPSGVPRPATRRRETTDTNPFSGGGGLMSPTAVGPGRFDSSWLGRKGYDAKDNEAPEEESKVSAPNSAKPAGFGGLARSNTAGGAGFPTVWGGASAATTPVTAGFGGFGNFALATPGVADKGFASSGGSRFFKKDDNPAPESAGAGTGASQTWRSRPRTDTDPFGGHEALSGSAALGGARDTSPPPMPTTGPQIFDTPAKGNASDFGMSGLSLGGSREGNASSASPSQTNPYRSPPADRGDNEREEVGYDKAHALGAQSEQNSNFGSMRGYPAAAFDGSDRSQTSSVGAKNYPSLGNIGGWPTAGGFPTATPDRERSAFGGAFGSSVFSPIGGDLQSPGLGNIGGLFGPASTGLAGSGSLRGSSKIQSLFPPAMQAQMQNQETESLADSIPDLRQSNPLGVIGGGTIGSQRDTDSPLPSMGQRSIMDLFASSQSVTSPGLFTTAEHGQSLLATAPQNHSFATSAQAPPFTPEQAATGPPQSQARTMVMPDRMRWVYMDPQGQQQGPFTGLEMNEWYKANYFTQDLRVRKVEDPDFEPLGQLIRRIGNSREPFLVPQVGIPHGPAPQSGPFSPGGDTRGVIPPLLGVVPSYGKTLTAEEQNNLERRKQEEQLAMARQRELMAQQSHFRNIHPAIPGGLQHQASLHSLQSQPSFGSMTSPIGMPPQPPIGAAMGTPTPGFFEQQPKGAAGLPNAMSSGPDRLRADLNEQERQMLANLHGPGGVSGMFPPQPVGAPPTDLRSQLPSVDQLERDPEGFKDRLKEFQEYQGIPTQRADEEAQPGPSQSGPAMGQADDANVANRSEAARVIKEVIQEVVQPRAELKKAEPQQQQQQPQQAQGLSLTQQVQKAQADAAQAAQRKAEENDAWAKQSASTGLPMPFPPPAPSANTPLAAPTAQRRSNIADQYVETRSQTQSPDSAAAAPPPLAPWAREPGSDSHRGPSLREIQEAEAKKAAKLEAERRAALEKEAALAKEREKVNPVLPGLPTTSTWGSGSPAPSASSPWAKPGVVKAAAIPVTPTGGERKKTLAEIQREEEALARKQKAAKEQAAQSAAVVGASSMGKRYAELASKTGPPGITAATAAAAAANAASTTASGWATVGAGGKVKVPTGPAAVQARPVSASNMRAPASPAAKPAAKPVAAPISKAPSTTEAQVEFQKWVKSELAKGLNPGTPADDVATFLFSMTPPDSQLIKDIIYGASSTMDPLRFSEEFIRRKRQADKGIFEPVPGSENKAGGWSEVAKKGGSSTTQAKEAEIPGAAGFKVVPGRKKGKK
ncbi:GYF domain-containing protein mpd2 [Cytospora mali]|uniref:GYF domain-containing protein mpd2 n=1 Tax=Cytospora mali TaxID=578113 RepID=A0A194VJ74_CYTMA|nr:GYF domain-containing protein mpd2 [Valsa mali]